MRLPPQGGMADCARGRLRGQRGELELALEGTFSDEQRWLPEKELRPVEWLEKPVEMLEEEIERRGAEYTEPIRRLVTIPGIDRKTAWTIVAAVGIDMRVYGDAKHLASWAGLCPGNRESAGKRMSGRTRQANRYIQRAMCPAAWAASHTQQTYRAAFYRRMSIRQGAPQAVMALAHHLLTVVYQVLAATSQCRRGQPCQCEEWGIICKHRGIREVNSLIQQPLSPGRFS